MKKKWYVTVEDKTGIQSPLIIKAETKQGAETSAMKYNGVAKIVSCVDYEQIKLANSRRAANGAGISKTTGKGGRKTVNRSGAYAT